MLTTSDILRQCLSNLRTNVVSAAMTQVPRSWGAHDFIPHLHKLYFIKEGEGWIQIDDQVFEPKPGQLLLLPAETRQSLASISSNTYLKYWCHFSASIGDTDLFQMLDTSYLLTIPQHEFPLIENIFEKLILQLKENHALSALLVNAALLELLHFFLERAGVHNMFKQSPLSFEKLTTVIQYINLHLSLPIKLEELALIIHVEPNYFAKLFKNMLGLSPMQYLNRMRIEKAKSLLIHSTLSVTEIAASVGFELHYFSRLFKSQESLSPLEYRIVKTHQSNIVL
ncbi:Arabinose operon regulatory protein [Paenibacillus allorhizoplanae]|uniref:Arabinose operon regulatory protein n=1 Tax=Paenibacillus allorhizoplanae TaxID=2905648 RepID=A0ABN8H0T0_9BACL|nr:AraC family transcriptional regulator [Paenibacillus allorhizoplanae]CAH1219641.1 Arabinose operon regulatory protein [Paenibacillus allorhizoplanae]